MKEETAKEKESSVVATGSCIQVARNNSYQAVATKYCKAWEEIKKYPNTCRYFESIEIQLQLIVCSGYNANDAFEAAGDHNQPYHSCIANQQEKIVFQPYYKSYAGCYKEKEEFPMMAHDTLCKYRYDIFVKEEYSYLFLLTGKHALDQLPLQMCFETSVKQAFSNPEGRPYTSFQQTGASSKKKFH